MQDTITMASSSGAGVSAAADNGSLENNDKPIQRSITAKITELCKPEYLEIVNESYKHNVPAGAESHFKITVVSDMFEGKSPIQRHRLINHCVADELSSAGGIHALSIQAKTPAQFLANSAAVETPNCLGGSKR